MALAKLEETAPERLEVVRPLGEVESEDRTRTQIARLDAIHVDRATERGVRRRYDGDRERRSRLLWLLRLLRLLRLLHDAAKDCSAANRCELAGQASGRANRSASSGVCVSVG